MYLKEWNILETSQTISQNFTEFIKDLLMFMLLLSHQKWCHFLEDAAITEPAFIC